MLRTTNKPRPGRLAEGPGRRGGAPRQPDTKNLPARPTRIERSYGTALRSQPLSGIKLCVACWRSRMLVVKSLLRDVARQGGRLSVEVEEWGHL